VADSQEKWRVRVFHLFRTMSGEFLKQLYGTMLGVYGLRGWIECSLVRTFAMSRFGASFSCPAHKHFSATDFLDLY